VTDTPDIDAPKTLRKARKLAGAKPGESILEALLRGGEYERTLSPSRAARMVKARRGAKRSRQVKIDAKLKDELPKAKSSSPWANNRPGPAMWPARMALMQPGKAYVLSELAPMFGVSGKISSGLMTAMMCHGFVERRKNPDAPVGQGRRAQQRRGSTHRPDGWLYQLTAEGEAYLEAGCPPLPPNRKPKRKTQALERARRRYGNNGKNLPRVRKPKPLDPEPVDLNIMAIEVEPSTDGLAPPAAARKIREPLAEALNLDQDPIAMTGDDLLDSLMKAEFTMRIDKNSVTPKSPMTEYDQIYELKRQARLLELFRLLCARAIGIAQGRLDSDAYSALTPDEKRVFHYLATFPEMALDNDA
jgi:hypothetical protein